MSNKISKKHKIISTDINNFINDPIRNIISDQTEEFDSKINNRYIVNFGPNAEVNNTPVGSFIVKTSGPLNVGLDQIENLQSSIAASAPIIDLNFNVEKHYENLKELQVDSKIQNTGQYFKFETLLEYNFFIKEYERFLLLNDNKINELSLPNLYELLLPSISSGQKFEFNGSTFFENINALNAILQVNNNANQKYLFNSEYVINNGAIKLSDFLSFTNNFKEQFPFYSQVTFNTHKKEIENFSNYFANNNLYLPMFNDFINNSQEADIIFQDSANRTNNTITNTKIKKISLDRIINTQLLKTSFNTLAAKKYRKFNDILNNKQSYIEVVGYVLQKFDVFRPRPNILQQQLPLRQEPIQEWYIPNLSDEYLQIIDTQVKYNKNYTYKLNFIVLSIGNRYKYTSVGSSIPDQVTINYTNQPIFELYLIENSSAYTNKIISKPPLPPDIEFIPYFGSDTEIKINLNTSSGRLLEIPVFLTQQEEKYFEEVRLSQNRPDSRIEFVTDEPLTKIQVFRTTRRIAGARDFTIQDLRTELNLFSLNASAASFDDLLEREKTYYYSFRGIDYHGGLSTMSRVFMVESKDGMIYVTPFVNQYEAKNYIKTANRLIKVAPSLGQLQPFGLDENDIDIGTNTTSLWNRNFKLRLASKKTGKKIDFNFNFKLEKKRL